MASLQPSRPGLLPNPTNVEEVWKDFRSILNPIFKEESISHARYMELYNEIYNYFYNIVYEEGRAKARYYDNSSGCMTIFEKLKDYLENHVTGVLQGCGELMDENLLCVCVSKFEQYKISSKKLNGICAFMNQWVGRSYEDNKIEDFNLFQLCLLVWRKLFASMLSGPVSVAINLLIERERNGEKVNQNLITRGISIWIELGIDSTLKFYQEHFEKPFLDHTKRYYQREAKTILAALPESESQNKIQERLEQEKTRARLYLHVSTEEKLIETCERALNSGHLEDLLAECSI